VILTYLQKESKGRLKFGLDLPGRREHDFFSKSEDAVAGITSVERAAAMQKVVDILTSRLNGSGVSEVVVRPVGVNSVKVDIPAFPARTWSTTYQAGEARISAGEPHAGFRPRRRATKPRWAMKYSTSRVRSANRPDQGNAHVREHPSRGGGQHH